MNAEIVTKKLKIPLIKYNAGICEICGDNTAMSVSGKLIQPCGKCGNEIEQRRTLEDAKRERIADPKKLMDEIYINKGWDSFKNPCQKQLECITKCKYWQNNFKVGEWLIMHGRQGTGKTVIKNILIRHIAENKICTLKSISAYSLFNAYMDYWNNNKNMQILVDYYSNFDCLIIDELGKQSTADGFKNFVNEIIDIIYLRNRSLIVLSNNDLFRVDMNDKYKRFISDFIDADRINERAVIIDFNYDSWRGK